MVFTTHRVSGDAQTYKPYLSHSRILVLECGARMRCCIAILIHDSETHDIYFIPIASSNLLVQREIQ